MPSRVLQEKFEVRLPYQSNDDAQNGWVDSKAARAKKNTPGREGRAGGDTLSKTMDNAVFYNTLPPGSDIEDQEMADIRQMETKISAESDVSSWSVKPAVFKPGYSHREMRGTDDMYTREHNDAFYDEITVDGDTGFVERNNMLDRE